jgi:hypothetical protein
MQYINCYICTCLALFFILAFIRLPEYHILQFHTFFLHISHRSGVDTVHCRLTMTVKEQALQQAIEIAVSHYDCFYEHGGGKLDVLSISNIQLFDCKLYPSDGMDGSNLEKCTGGRCNVSFRIAYNSPLQNGLKISDNFRCENVDFEVISYKEEKFTVKITNKRLTL